MAQPLLILASRSARRAKLLHDAGFMLRQVTPAFDDPPQPDHTDDPTQLAIDLAEAKARDVARAIRGTVHPSRGAIVLAADTICVGGDGVLFGQPADRDAARRMILAFAMRTHEVVTGVALLRMRDDRLVTFADTVAVTFGELDAATVDAYVLGDQWKGKAGGYNLFDRQAAGWPITLAEGADPTTVVGLPMRKVIAALGDLGVRPG
jgi:septum formation protein